MTGRIKLVWEKYKIVIIVIIISVLAISGIAGAVNQVKYSILHKNYVAEGLNADHMPLSTTVSYKGKNYSYNDAMINILVIGIDSDKPVSQEQEYGYMGQMDAIYLVSINTKDKSEKVFGIPRDTIGEIDIYNEDGELVNLIEAQLALQYAFSTNYETSYKLSAEAVSRVMYNIPINRVCVFNCSAIGLINDAVGGVEVTIENDFTDESGEVLEEEFVKGNTVKLNGEQAITFVRERDCSIFASAMDRVSRQEQYIGNLISVLKSQLKKKPISILNIYNKLLKEDCIYTDISKSELMYLATYARHFTLSSESMITIPGQVKGGEEYEEYHIDEQALKQMVIERFYR